MITYNQLHLPMEVKNVCGSWHNLPERVKLDFNFAANNHDGKAILVSNKISLWYIFTAYCMFTKKLFMGDLKGV